MFFKNVNTIGTFLYGIVCAGLIILPFVFWPNGAIQYEVPRTIFMHRWIEIIGLLALCLTLCNYPLSRHGLKLVGLATAFLVLACLASWLGVDVSRSILGNYYRADGLLTLIHFVVFFLILVFLWRREWLQGLLWAMATGSMGISLIAAIQGFQVYILHQMGISPWGGAIVATFGNPNFLAGYLVVTLPLVTYMLVTVPKRIRICIYIGLVFQLTAIVLTFTWAGIVGILLFFLGEIFLKKGVSFKKISFVISIYLLITAVTAFYKLSRPTKEYVAEGRPRIFMKLLIASSQKPLLGWGWANVGHAFQSVEWPIHFDTDIYVDKAHSLILESLVTTGIPGLILYLLILFFTGKNLYMAGYRGDRKDGLIYRTLFLSFILYCIHSQMNIIPSIEELVFWIIAGVSVQAQVSTKS